MTDELQSWQPGIFGWQGTNALPIPARYVQSADIFKPADAGVSYKVTGPDVAPAGEDYTVMLADGGGWHYFHLMESVVWLRALQATYLADRAPRCIVIETDWDDPRLNGIGRKLLGLLYPGTRLADVRDLWPERMGPMLIIDRRWAKMPFNKVVEAAMRFAGPAVQAMGRQVRTRLPAFDGQARTGRVLYVTRAGRPRHLEAGAEARLLASLARFGPLTCIDFAAVPWEHQVRLAAAHDVMVSVHGNGLTNALWMRPGSLVIELFSPGAHHYDYQFYAELAGLSYAGFDGDRMFRDGERAGEPYGHGSVNDGVVTYLPLAGIEAALAAYFAV